MSEPPPAPDPDDLAHLRAEADRIAALRADPRTPAICRRALLRTPPPPIGPFHPRPITPRIWLQLEETASPLLTGDWPCTAPAALLQAICGTLAILTGEPLTEEQFIDAIPVSDIPRLLTSLHALTARATGTSMKMRYPTPSGMTLPPVPDDHFPWIPRLIARIATSTPIPPDAILDTPLDLLFLLDSSLASIEGATATGPDYRDRT